MDKRKLGPRLNAVASFVPNGSRVADIGTDHAHLPIWLRTEKISPMVIASDIRPGPLNTARLNVEKSGVDRICFRLCPGLQDIRPDEADTVVIAGMSGETIRSILENANWDWKGKRLILEANTKHALLLSWIYAHDLHVDGELFPEENGRVYRVYTAVCGHAALPRPAFLWGGFSDCSYARRQAAILREALRGMELSNKPEDLSRRTELKTVLEDMIDAYHWRDSE